MSYRATKQKVGEVRSSQLLFTFGVGAIIDLPNLSVMVMGLDDWDYARAREIVEERLLAAARAELGAQVKKLLAPPIAPESTGGAPAPLFDGSALVGVPVAPFPRWLVCPSCRLLAPLKSGLFQLKTDLTRAERTRFVHGTCNRAQQPPTALPARFLVACERGHLDDFPWDYFVHRQVSHCASRLRLWELGVSGEAADVQVVCETCKSTRRMSDAFGDQAPDFMPACAGRRPHLRDYADDTCPETVRAILLGASNSWFPVALNALSIPAATDRLGQLLAEHWSKLQNVTSLQNVELLRQVGVLSGFGQSSDAEIWAAIEARRAAPPAEAMDPTDLKTPEWQVLSRPNPAQNTSTFRLREVDPPVGYQRVIQRVVLAERLREVRALAGFTRIESPGDWDDAGEVPIERRAALGRHAPQWLPAVEVRGEGIFLQFRESTLHEWTQRAPSLAARDQAFAEAYRLWRVARSLPVDQGYLHLGYRYVLLHSFAHALMRQLALDCGYAVASIRERIYSLPPEADAGPMAGVLLYTAAPDSEGTLGGLVSLGEPDTLGWQIDRALERIHFCASDPLCAEHHPLRDGASLHGAACHGCLFAPETSCERGNRYLDRFALVPTLARSPHPYF